MQYASIAFYLSSLLLIIKTKLILLLCFQIFFNIIKMRCVELVKKEKDIFKLGMIVFFYRVNNLLIQTRHKASFGSGLTLNGSNLSGQNGSGSMIFSLRAGSGCCNRIFIHRNLKTGFGQKRRIRNLVYIDNSNRLADTGGARGGRQNLPRVAPTFPGLLLKKAEMTWRKY